MGVFDKHFVAYEGFVDSEPGQGYYVIMEFFMIEGKLYSSMECLMRLLGLFSGYCGGSNNSSVWCLQ